jgi:DNA primase
MDAVEEIKSRLAIEDVLAEYVQLKRAGRNYKGLSPFSGEKTPSFVVSPEKQIWHDFSSNKGGDMFTFVMEVEGLDFRGALELLARKAGVDLEQFGNKRGDGKQKERLYELVDLAVKFYQVQFTGSKLALSYVLQQRQFSKETALTWRLGYAPNNGQALVQYAQTKGFTTDELKRAGLTNQYGGDLFRRRLMIPLMDASGRPIGFTARLLGEDPKAPKYINTPQTQLYDKSRHVFGLHLAKEAIRKSKFVVLAEGNLDVIASHQAGVRQCVATAGTALTEQQLKALGRMTPDVRVSFDADRAGLAATERAIPIASKVGVTLSVITIPSGKDPDELIRQDKSLWEAAIQQHEPALDWLITRHQKEHDLSSAAGKRQFTDVIFAVVRQLDDTVEQEHYVQRVAKIIGVNADALSTKLQEKPLEAPRKTVKHKPQFEQYDKQALERIRAENRLMALLLLQPRLRDIATELKDDYLYETPAKALLAFLVANPDFDGNPNQAATLHPIKDYVKILSLQYEELYQDLDLLELRYEAERLQSYLVEQYVKTKKTELSQRLQSVGEAETYEILGQVKQLDALLKQYKGGA